MAGDTILAVFDRAAHAEAAASDILNSAISLSGGKPGHGTTIHIRSLSPGPTVLNICGRAAGYGLTQAAATEDAIQLAAETLATGKKAG